MSSRDTALGPALAVHVRPFQCAKDDPCTPPASASNQLPTAQTSAQLDPHSPVQNDDVAKLGEAFSIVIVVQRLPSKCPSFGVP
jgi:hypothetical protein